MDYPFFRKERYDVSNNWWFLPTNVFKAKKDQEDADQRKSYPLLDYIGRIDNKDKFIYIVIVIAVICFIYRLNLRSTIWIGLIVGIFVVYYMNEKYEQEINRDADQLWVILKSDLLKQTRYFITDPILIRWVSDVGELKKYNVLDFNKMIKTLDQMLRVIDDMQRGVSDCKANYDIIKDLKVSALNQFHGLIYRIPYPALRRKYDYYLSELGKHLNDHTQKLLRIFKVYYMNKPIDIKSAFDEPTLDDPVPLDPYFDKHYNYFN